MPYDSQAVADSSSGASWTISAGVVRMLLALGILVTSLLSSSAGAISMLAIDEQTGVTNLAEVLEYYADDTGLLTYQQIVELPAESWTQIKGSSISFGFTESAYWFRFQVQSNAQFKMEPIISIANPRFDSVNLYKLTDREITQYIKTGSRVPFAEKPIKHRYQLLPLKLNPGSISTIYIQAKNSDAFQLPIELWSEDDIRHFDQQELLNQGIFLGIWLIAVLGNIAMAIAFRRSAIRGYNGFTAFIFFFGLFQLSIYGIGGGEFWTSWPNLPDIASIYSIGFAVISGCWCVWTLLDLRNSNRIGLVVLLALSGVAALYMFAYLFVPFRHIIFLLHLLVVPTAISVGVIMLHNFMQGHRQNPISWISWLLVAATVLFMALSRLGWIPNYPLWYFGTSILFIGMMLITTISVIFFIARQRTGTLEDVLQYERSARENQALLNERLEHDFHSKDQDLSLALHKLTETNKTLLQISTSDQTTGIKNRHFFDDIYNIEWRRARRQKYPICLMMIDIDHFQKINDTYGHPVGDICLRDVADTIKRSLRRPADIVARFGGKQFILLLPYLSMENGSILAERIRTEINSLMTITAGHMIQLTVSIGISTTLPTPDINPDELVQSLEKAVHQAKEEGRNRVCVAAPM